MKFTERETTLLLNSLYYSIQKIEDANITIKGYGGETEDGNSLLEEIRDLYFRVNEYRAKYFPDAD
jgi:hypothetical protein